MKFYFFTSLMFAATLPAFSTQNPKAVPSPEKSVQAYHSPFDLRYRLREGLNSPPANAKWGYSETYHFFENIPSKKDVHVPKPRNEFERQFIDDGYLSPSTPPPFFPWFSTD